MDKEILYLGDTSLNANAAYLAGIMTHYNICFDYLGSDEKLDPILLDNSYKAVIISDYPSCNFSAEQLNSIIEKVNTGTGLLMLGGWDSYTGLEGQYNKTALKDVLPVIMTDTDDRVNCSSPCLVEKNCEHKIIEALPFNENTPGIGGYNRFKSKPESTTVLSSRRFQSCRVNGKFEFTASQQSDPLLVTGRFGQGNVTSFATDVAPHWVGGLVDWGNERVIAEAANSYQIEVGSWYAKFFAQMLRWTAQTL